MHILRSVVPSRGDNLNQHGYIIAWRRVITSRATTSAFQNPLIYSSHLASYPSLASFFFTRDSWLLTPDSWLLTYTLRLLLSHSSTSTKASLRSSRLESHPQTTTSTNLSYLYPNRIGNLSNKTSSLFLWRFQWAQSTFYTSNATKSNV